MGRRMKNVQTIYRKDEELDQRLHKATDARVTKEPIDSFGVIGAPDAINTERAYNNFVTSRSPSGGQSGGRTGRTTRSAVVRR
jgi:hypothetical protein